MTATHQCSECGSGLSVEAPAGLCPHCLLKLALDSSSVGEPCFLPEAPSFLDAKVQYFGDYELIAVLGFSSNDELLVLRRAGSRGTTSLPGRRSGCRPKALRLFRPLAMRAQPCLRRMVRWFCGMSSPKGRPLF